MSEMYEETAVEEVIDNTQEVTPEVEVETPTPEGEKIVTEGDGGDALKAKDLLDTETKEEIKYNDFTLAEGLAVDDEILKETQEVFKKLGLSQEQAQGLVDLQNKLVKKQDTSMMKSIETETTKLIDKWENEVRNDAELGGADLAEKMAIARFAAKKLGSEDALQVLSEAKLGSNPAILRLLYRAGKALGEGSYIEGKQSSSSERILTDILYDKSKMK